MKTCLKIFIVLSLLSTISLAQDGLISIRNITFTYQNLTKINLTAGDNLTLELNLSTNFSFYLFIYNSTNNAASISVYSKLLTNLSNANSLFTFTAPKTDTYSIRLQANSNFVARYNLTLSLNGQFWDTRSSWIVGEVSLPTRSFTTDLKPIMGGTLIYKYKLYNSPLWVWMNLYDGVYSPINQSKYLVINSKRNDSATSVYTTTVSTSKTYFPVLAFNKTINDGSYQNYTV